MSFLGLLIRVTVGAVFLIFGGAKLTRMPFAAHTMWRPTWVSGPVMVTLVVCISLTETLVGLNLALGFLRPLSTAILTGLVLAGLSTYGNVAIRYGGHCGCTGDKVEPKWSGRSTEVKRVWTRNLSILAAAVLGTMLTPTIGPLTGESARLVPYLSFVPLSALFAVVIWRLVTAWMTRPDFGRAALYRRLTT